MATDPRKSLCDRRKASMIAHHNHHYLDITTTLIILIPLQIILKQSFP